MIAKIKKNGLKIAYGCCFSLALCFALKSVYFKEHEVTYRPNQKIAYFFAVSPGIIHLILGFLKFSSIEKD